MFASRFTSIIFHIMKGAMVFPCSTVKWVFKEKINGWFWNNLCSEDIHCISGLDFLYFDRSKVAVSYIIDDIRLGPRRDLDEDKNPWVMVYKLGVLVRIIFVLTKLYLFMFPEDNLKSSHYSTNIKFMWWGDVFFIPYFNIEDDLTPL